MRIHAVEKPCSSSFVKKLALNEHMKVHIGETPYSCDQCIKSFSRLVELKQHLELYTGEKSFSCLTCFQTFNNKKYLQKHVKIHVGNTEDRPFRWSECTKSYASSATLRAHKKFMQWWKHTVVHFVLKLSSTLPVWSRIWDLTQERNPTAAAFAPWRFLSHHTGESIFVSLQGRNLFRCEQCTKAFITPQQLKSHMKVHTEETVALFAKWNSHSLRDWKAH